jgi:hypothetical protein
LAGRASAAAGNIQVTASTTMTSRSGLRNWAAFLRGYHDALAGYRPPAGSTWSSGPGTCARGEIICHGDFGPWNGVWHGERIAALIDFDHARPAPPIFDIAYALEYAAPFRDNAECLRWLRYPRPPDRRRRIEIFCDAYGIAVPADITGRVACQLPGVGLSAGFSPLLTKWVTSVTTVTFYPAPGARWQAMANALMTGHERAGTAAASAYGRRARSA